MLKIVLLISLAISSVFASAESDIDVLMNTLGSLFVVFVMALFIVQILYILSIVKTIDAVKTEHSRSIAFLPWLTLLPIIGWIVGLVVVSKLSGDFKLYVQKYEIKELYFHNGGQTKGMITYIAFILSLIPFLGFLTGIVGFVAWIMYWIELGNMRSTIAMFKIQEQKNEVVPTIREDVTPEPIPVEVQN